MSSITREYLSIGCPKYDEIVEGIRKSYPNACILWIEEISNSELEEKYIAQRVEIQCKRGSCKEIELYHGTNASAVVSIINNGFRVDMNKTSAYGKGTYFAKRANLSVSYAKDRPDEVSFMLICSVLVGKCHIYIGGRGDINIVKHDNSVDNIQNPLIYVTPYDNGAIPRYIVAMHKNAK